MRDYLPRKKNKYRLPTPVYHQTVWQIRDYDRICERLADILLESPDPPDGMPHGANLSEEVYVKAKQRENLKWKKGVIDAAIGSVPEEYRRGVWDNVQERKSFPRNADRATYGRWKSRFIIAVARDMGFIE